MGEGQCCNETDCKNLFLKFKEEISKRVTVNADVSAAFDSLETVLIQACTAPQCQGGADAAA